MRGHAVAPGNVAPESNRRFMSLRQYTSKRGGAEVVYPVRFPSPVGGCPGGKGLMGNGAGTVRSVPRTLPACVFLYRRGEGGKARWVGGGCGRRAGRKLGPVWCLPALLLHFDGWIGVSPHPILHPASNAGLDSTSGNGPQGTADPTDLRLGIAHSTITRPQGDWPLDSQEAKQMFDQLPEPM